MIIAKMVFKLGGIHHQNQILRSHFRKLHQCQRYQCYQCQCCSLSAGDLVICSSIDINDECNKCNKHAEVMHRSCMSKTFLHFFCWHLNWYIIYLRFNTECLASYIYLSIYLCKWWWHLEAVDWFLGEWFYHFIEHLQWPCLCAATVRMFYIESSWNIYHRDDDDVIFYRFVGASLAPPRLIVAGSHNFIERLKENRSDWRKFSGMKMIIIVTTNRVHRAPVIVK